jgi:hypothetical protein
MKTYLAEIIGPFFLVLTVVSQRHHLHKLRKRIRFGSQETRNGKPVALLLDSWFPA